MKYLKLFNSEAEYIAFKDSTEFLTPNVSVVEDLKVWYNPSASESTLFSIDLSTLPEKFVAFGNYSDLFAQLQNLSYNGSTSKINYIGFAPLNEEEYCYDYRKQPVIRFEDGTQINFNKDDAFYKWARTVYAVSDNSKDFSEAQYASICCIEIDDFVNLRFNFGLDAIENDTVDEYNLVYANIYDDGSYNFGLD